MQLIHQRVNLRVGALDRETRERPRKARNPFAPFAPFRVIRGPNPPQSLSPAPSIHTTRTPVHQSAGQWPRFAANRVSHYQEWRRRLGPNLLMTGLAVLVLWQVN